MSEKYTAIMDKIEVTEEMRLRILQNVCKEAMQDETKAIQFPRWKRCLSIAACMAVILMGILLAPRIISQPQGNPPAVEETPMIEDCPSVDWLSRCVGFPIAELTFLPFEVDRVIYTAYWGQLGEINYIGKDGQAALYRKSVGTGDNSGNYNDFKASAQLSTDDGWTVTLKGTDENYTLAWWTDGEYAYSICLTNGVGRAEWSEMLANNRWR